VPTILRRGGLRFFFYSADWNEPIHVHVDGGGGVAKFWVRPVGLVRSRGINARDLRRMRIIVEEEQALFEEKWDEYFAGKS
jgi:hypothetical protein